MDELFFELIRASLEDRNGFSKKPTEREWRRLYRLAEKHALLGVCYRCLQSLEDKEQWPPSDLVIQWTGACTQIKQRNRTLNEQCVEIQKELRKGGYRSCILKGQGNVQMYPEPLLRTSGDIDIWVEGGFEKVMNYTQRTSKTDHVTEHHVEFDYFPDTPVEVHFTPSKLFNRIFDRRFQKWIGEEEGRQFAHFVDLEEGRIFVPTLDFNLVYQLSHIYRHMFGGGIGLRQLTDYYMLLRAMDLSRDEVARVKLLVRRFGMNRFAESLMWVMGYVFHLDRSKMMWTPNDKTGRFVLSEIMKMGNFGHADHRFDLDKGASHFRRYCQRLRGKFRFVKYFPMEVMWMPIDMLVTFFELRRLRRKANEIGRQMSEV